MRKWRKLVREIREQDKIEVVTVFFIIIEENNIRTSEQRRRQEKGWNFLRYLIFSLANW